MLNSVMKIRTLVTLVFHEFTPRDTVMIRGSLSILSIRIPTMGLAEVGSVYKLLFLFTEVVLDRVAKIGLSLSLC